MVKKHNKGYTLIELIISISIIVLMVGIVVGTYTFGRDHDTAKAETEKAASALRNARGRAFGGITLLFDTSFCSIGDCSIDYSPCRTDAECPSGQTCNFSRFCADNAGCTNINTNIQRGHCTRSRYPQSGYAVHFTASDASEGNRSTYTQFADLGNADGSLPYLDDAEVIEKFKIPSQLKLILNNNESISDTEIFFNNNKVTIYENLSGWQPFTQPLYTITVQHKDGCEKIGKKGVITLATSTQKIFHEFIDC